MVMTDTTPVPKTAQHGAPSLSTLLGPRKPPGTAGQLTDRILVHASGDNALKLAEHLPAASGLVLSGKKAHDAARALRAAAYGDPILIDPGTYVTAEATPERPFALNDDGMFPISLEDVLNAQLNSGAVAALTPTGYLHAGDTKALKAAIRQVAQLDRQDVILTLPLDAAWLTGDHIDTLIAVLARLDVPKAVLLASQFDPMTRYNTIRTVKNLRRLLAEAGHVAPLRTDTTGFDALAHGAFTTSIGTGGSLRHIVPFGQRPRSSKVNDQSPSVLYAEVLTFYRGSTIAQRYANHFPPTCQACGRSLDTYLRRADSTDAHVHGLHTWGRWADEMRRQATLGDRAIWWRNSCRLAVAESDAINLRIGQDGAFSPSETVSVWADLPAW
jgi:hypothetical protein